MRVRKNSRVLILFLIMAVMTAVTPAFAIKNSSSASVQPEIVEKDVKYVSKINFDDVLKKAQEHSYDLKIADYEVLISKQDIRSARSEYFPKLTFIAGTEYTKNYRDLKDSTIMTIGDAFINPYTRYQSIMGITVAYNLFDFGVRGDNVKIAKTDVLLKELETKQKMQEMHLTLLDSYAKILVTTKQIELNQEILACAENNLEMKERLFKAREISKMDLNDAKVQVSTTKNKISDLKSIREDSLNWLSFYTGEKYNSENLKVEELKKTDFNVLEFQDYTKSLVWKIHEKNIKKKELELTVAKKNYLPKLNAYGRYYLYGSNYNNFGKSFDIEPSNFSVGASLYMPIFDGFKNSALVQRTIIELKQLQVERDKAIAEFAARLAGMRSNLMYLDEQIAENEKIISELTDKEKSVHKLVSKKLSSPIEENEAKIELLNQMIELEKNTITANAIVRGIQELTIEN